MTRKMYDSVTASHIPRDAEMVAGYVSGKWKWSRADWDLFPNAIKVPIATQASVNDGVVLDVEPGDATPLESPAWVQRRRQAGVVPTVYCNLSTWPSVINAFVLARITQPNYWIARYDNKATMIANAVAKQYADPVVHGQGHFDLSIVADYWPGIDREGTIMSNTQLDIIQNIVERVSWRIYALEQGWDHLSVTLTNGDVLEEDVILNKNIATVKSDIEKLSKEGLPLQATGEILITAKKVVAGSEV